MAQDREETVEPAGRAEWRSWLERHADDGRGVWLALQKGDRAPLTYDEAVDEALAAGWIDSKPGRLDERRYRLWLAPRKPHSNWSAANKERVARLVEQRRMTPRGAAVVAAAKADGSWEALDKVQALEEPVDLAAALDAVPTARSFYDAFPPSSKRIILEWVAGAKTDTTRRRRVDETVRLAAENLRANHWRQPSGRPAGRD